MTIRPTASNVLALATSSSPFAPTTIRAQQLPSAAADQQQQHQIGAASLGESAKNEDKLAKSTVQCSGPATGMRMHLCQINIYSKMRIIIHIYI